MLRAQILAVDHHRACTTDLRVAVLTRCDRVIAEAMVGGLGTAMPARAPRPSGHSHEGNAASWYRYSVARHRFTPLLSIVTVDDICINRGV